MPPKMSAMMARILADPEAIEHAKGAAERAKYFDNDGPQVKARRAAALKEFEFVIQSVLPDERMWDINTITRHTCVWLDLVALHIKDATEEEAKIEVLYSRKQALYWWIIRKVPTFQGIFWQWHATCGGAIGIAVLRHNFSTATRECDNRTSMEPEAADAISLRLRPEDGISSTVLCTSYNVARDIKADMMSELRTRFESYIRAELSSDVDYDEAHLDAFIKLELQNLAATAKVVQVNCSENTGVSQNELYALRATKDQFFLGNVSRCDPALTVAIADKTSAIENFRFEMSEEGLEDEDTSSEEELEDEDTS